MSTARDDETSGPSPSRVGLKTFLDDHPLSALVGFSVSAATIVAGVMTYYTSQRLDAAETRHKAELIELATTNKANLLDATTPLKQTIADLTFRLSSIERRIPGSGPTYFDVSSISVGPETIKALTPKYRSFDEGGFYVAIPEMGDWTYDEINEFDFLSSIFDFLNGDESPLMRKIAGESKLYVWRGKSEIKFKGSAGPFGEPTFTFFPAITIQKISAELVKNRLSAMAAALDNSSDDKAHLKAMADAVDELHKQTRVANDASKNDEANEPVQATSGTDAAKDVLQTAKRNDEILENLSSAYSADDASFVLSDYLSSAMMQTMSLGAHHRVYSTQKKGNVLYLQDRITFHNVRVYEGAKLGEAKQNVVVDEEVFYFGKGAEGYLVKVYLPPVPDRADAFSWIKSWLTGLQIPLG
jgi:hypothetical protein